VLSVTFLGHQGWMISAGTTRILIDPVLTDFFGAVPEAGMRLFPPRVCLPDRCPPVTAVVITHEHDDHFQIASLERLSRRIPIFLSARSSVAARAAAELMGFEVIPLEPGSDLDLGALVLRTFPPALDDDCYDEWDVVPFLVRDKDRPAAFLSTVDLPPRSTLPRMVEGGALARAVTFANNRTSRHALTSWMPAPAGSLPVVTSLLGLLADWPAGCQAPELVLTSGSGWSFAGELEWLNRSFFPTDMRRLAKGMRTIAPCHGVRISGPLPGQTFLVEGKEGPAADPPPAAFLTPAPRASWPNRRFDPTAPRAAEVTPVLGDDFSASDLERLQARLPSLARGLVGGRPFRALHSLSEKELAGRVRALVLFAQTSRAGEGYLFEYAPARCDFVPARFEVDAYATGAVCWASDLLALLEGRLTASALTMGHWFEWVGCHPREPQALSLKFELWRLCNPLTMPDEFLAFYRRLAEGCAGAGPRVPAASDGLRHAPRSPATGALLET
jgi:hypothetical protein